MALTNKQRVFIAEYTKNFNATRAAIAAGYSEHTARSIGQENLTKPDVAAEIESIIAERCMGKDEVLLRLAEQARAEYSAYIKEDGTVDTANLVKAGKAHLIKGIKETKYGKDIEFYDAFAAQVQIGKHHKLFVERHELTGKDGAPVVEVERLIGLIYDKQSSNPESE